MNQPDPALPASTKQWIINQLFSGVQPMNLVKQLLADGFTFEAITKALGTNLPQGLAYNRDSRFFQKLAERPFVSHKKLIDYSNDDVQLYAVPDFLTRQECDQVIRYAMTDLKPSRVADNDNYQGHRTSTTAELSFMQRPELLAVEKKIIDFMALGVGENEVMQAQHYAPGQEFKAHTDYFLPGAKEYKTDARNRGQRTWTFMLYLNEQCSGGETEFIELNRRFTPETGKALIWNNLYPNGCPNPNTLHCSHPVQSGEKVIITKWFRTFD